MNIRFLIREILHSKSQALVFILCVALSLVSIVAINSFRNNVQQSIAGDARGLHGGDVIVHSHYEFSPALQQEITRLAGEPGNTDRLHLGVLFRRPREQMVGIRCSVISRQ